MKVTLILEADSKTLGSRKPVANDVLLAGAAIVALMGCEGMSLEQKKRAFEMATEALKELGITVKKTELEEEQLSRPDD